MILSDLRDRMRTYANVDENRLDDASATDFLNLAKDEIQDETRLRVFESLITTAFTSGAQTINPAPTTGRVRQPTRLWYADDSGEKVDVNPITWNQYVEHYGTAATATGGTGDPTHFAIYGQDDDGNPTFYLGPIPDADKTVYLAARIGFADLSEDDDENPLTIEAWRALVFRALELASTYLELPERAPEWRKTYDEEIRRLVISNSGARYSAMHGRSMQEPG